MLARKITLKIFKSLGGHGLLKWISDEKYIKIFYYLVYGKKINLDNPYTFTEKLQWLKLNNRSEVLTLIADKTTVHRYLQEKNVKCHLINVLWTGTNADDIPYDNLPDKFVIKCNHGSHCNIIVSDKRNINKKNINKKINKWLKKNWFWYGREWPYKNIKPKIIIEEYMTDNGYSIKDYKFFCIRGNVEFCQIISDRYSEETMNFYDTDWQELNIHRVDIYNKKSKTSTKPISKPSEYDKMIHIAEKLSEDFDFCRVDLYYINNEIYFGEITFYPANGFCDFMEKEFNDELSTKLVINKK